MIQEGIPDFDGWRSKARGLLLEGIPPAAADWDPQPKLFSDSRPNKLRPLSTPTMPPEFFDLASAVACARDPAKWDLLYRLIYRLNHENKNLLQISVDADVHRAFELKKSVSRDIHKMHAFVRFKKTDVAGQETYVAWHQPEHLIVAAGTPFFVRRFGDKPWSIFTPDASAHWDLKELTFSTGMLQRDFEHLDPFDEVWKTYYKSIFNPARLKLKAMRAEMSPKYWASMPESAVIHDLIRDTPRRLQNMAAAPRYQAEVSTTAALPELREAASKCRACPLAEHATHTVFGEGNPQARLMIVGEQPGDEEDRAGAVFVGPAGQVLNEALQLAGIARESVYLTNAVKHFKWTRHEKMRLHKKASGSEMQACKPWLEAEIARVQPKVILALGATAGTALFGKLMKIQNERGRPNHQSAYAETLLLSWHPAAILRSSHDEERAQRMTELVSDLRLALESSLEHSQEQQSRSALETTLR